MDEQFAEAFEAGAAVLTLGAVFIGGNDQFAGIAEAAAGELDEAVFGGAVEGDDVQGDAEFGFGGAFVDVLATGAAAGDEGERERSLGHADAGSEFDLSVGGGIGGHGWRYAILKESIKESAHFRN